MPEIYESIKQREKREKRKRNNVYDKFLQKAYKAHIKLLILKQNNKK